MSIADDWLVLLFEFLLEVILVYNRENGFSSCKLLKLPSCYASFLCRLTSILALVTTVSLPFSHLELVVKQSVHCTCPVPVSKHIFNPVFPCWTLHELSQKEKECWFWYTCGELASGIITSMPGYTAQQEEKEESDQTLVFHLTCRASDRHAPKSLYLKICILGCQTPYRFT